MDGVSIAASLVGLGTAGCQIAIKLYTLASQISTASQRISSVSNDISLTSGVLKELGDFMTRETADGGTGIFSQSGLETTKTSAAICETIFHEIERAAKEASEQLRTRDRIVGKIKLSKSEKAKWPFLQPSIESLRIDLREAKGTLMLMLQLMNLALSQRMATIHQTTTTSVVEQREIFRAILAIQKQSQGNSSSRAEHLSIDCSSHGTPRPVSPPSPASHTVPKETPLPAEELTVVSPSLAGPAAPPSSSPHVLMAMQGLDKPDPSVLQESTKEPTEDRPSSGPVDPNGETPHNSLNSDSDQSSSGGSNMPRLNATVENHCEQHKALEFFALKPSIKDDPSRPGAVSLTFWNEKIPMRQVDIRKRLSSKEEDLQPVLDAYLDLFDYERDVIRNLIEVVSPHASLMLLKRRYVDITHRGILFKGVPELQFILESLMKDKSERVLEITEQMNMPNSNRPTYIRVHRKHISPDTLNTYDLPWQWEDGDFDYILIKRWINEGDQNILFEHTRKTRELRLRDRELVEMKLVREKNADRSRSTPDKPVEQDKNGEGTTSVWEASVRHHHPTRLSDVREEDESDARTVESKTRAAAAAAGAAADWIVNASPPRSQRRSPGHSIGFGDDSWDEKAHSHLGHQDRSRHRSRDRSRHRSPGRSRERRRGPSHFQDNDFRAPSPYLDTVTQRIIHRMNSLESIEKVDESYQTRELSDSGNDVHRARYNSYDSDDSDDSDESIITTEDAMDDEEAEKAVKELLGKYTTLGAVVGEEVGGSG